MLRGRHEPGGGVFRHAAILPDLERAAEGVLDDVFCQREVMDTEHAGQRGHHPPRLPPEQILVQPHYIPVFRIGRTSTTPPPSRIGHPSDNSTAWARSRASIRV